MSAMRTTAQTTSHDDHGGYRVYAVMAGPFTKIGYTRRGKLRLADLQTGCPLPLSLADYWPVTDETHARKVEAFMHSVLHEYRGCGEWFLCGDAAVTAAATAALAIDPRSTWEDFDAAARPYGGPSLARTTEARRRSGAAAIKAAAKPERHRELSEALVAWLVGFDPVQRRRENVAERRKAERANKVANRAKQGKGQHKPHKGGSNRKTRKVARSAAGPWPTQMFTSNGRRG